jgi:hypothetical protein
VPRLVHSVHLSDPGVRTHVLWPLRHDVHGESLLSDLSSPLSLLLELIILGVALRSVMIIGGRQDSSCVSSSSPSLMTMT